MEKTPTLPQILSLARTGSPVRAWSVFVDAGWDKVLDDPKALTLKGRLLKDQAKAASEPEQREQQVRLYGEAAQAYATAAEIRTDSYPLINAAALALLGGNAEQAAELASQVLALIDSDPNEGENAYWRRATRAEAMLLLGREDEAQAELANAIAQLPNAWEDHAATIGQFALILNAQGRSAEWLDQYRPPSSIHFSGMIRLSPSDFSASQAIEEFLQQEQPGFAYGALAAGSDLLFARAFLQHKARTKTLAELHVVLPYPAMQFRALSVTPFGPQWEEGFDKVMQAADTVTILGLDDPPPALAVEIADHYAMGRALRNANNLQSRAKAVTLAGHDENLRPQLQYWRDVGQELAIIYCQRQPSTQGSFAQQKSAQSLATLIWLGRGTKQIMERAKQAGVTLHPHKKGCWFIHHDIVTAYRLAKHIAGSTDDGQQIALLHAIMDVENPATELLSRAEALASASRSGAITTDNIGAMALTLTGAAQSIEEIGELKTIWGALPLWRII
jgi:hypothetical protein